jgi:glycosyltransferase involved in cell wall biosynthesis
MAEQFRKIKVLEMHSSFGYAGGQRNLFSFAKYFDRNLFEVFAASYIEGGVYEDKLNQIGVKTLVSRSEAKPILDFIAQNKIDVIHIHRSGGTVAIETAILQGAKKINPNLIIVEKNIFGKYDAENVDIIGCSFFQSMMHLNERYLRASGSVFDFVRMKVMYNMVDGKEFEKHVLTPEQVLEERKKLGIGKNDFVLGRIGRPDIAKWSDLVIGMAPYLVKLLPNFKFILMGVPLSRKKIIKNSALSDHYIILEPSSDEKVVHTFYQVIDVLGHSSKIGECNGNTINEAMYWRKPVITNSTPKKDNGQLEQFEHMKSGIVANHPQTFARAVEFLAKNKAAAKSMGDEAYWRVAKINEPLTTVKRMEKYLAETVGASICSWSQSILDKYNQITYYPGAKEIENYGRIYKNRLREDYGKLTISEIVSNKLKIPRKFITKIEDFIEHRFG